MTPLRRMTPRGKGTKAMNKLFYLLGAGLLLVPGLAIAADLDVTCETSVGGGITCDTVPPGAPLFNETNLVPGATVMRILTVTNNHDEPCGFVLDTENEVVGTFSLADRLWTVIRSMVDRFGISDGLGRATNNKTMSNVFTAGPIALGTLAAGSVTDYEWAVTFDKDTGNEWQGEKTTFDFDMAFTCVEGTGGGDDEPDCCPGPDPSLSPSPTPRALGMMSEGPPPGGIIDGLLDRFPGAGAASAARWLAGEGRDWSRAAAAALAMVLTALFIIRVAIIPGKYKAPKHK